MTSKNYFFSSNLIEISKKAAILEKDEEFWLINDWRDNKTPKSLQKILNSYLRLAVSYAMKVSLELCMLLKNLTHQRILDFQHMLHGG